jgi:hypothetical protein
MGFEPMMRVLQDLTGVFGYLIRLILNREQVT